MSTEYVILDRKTYAVLFKSEDVVETADWLIDGDLPLKRVIVLKNDLDVDAGLSFAARVMVLFNDYKYTEDKLVRELEN